MYRHTQQSPLHYLVYLASAVIFVLAWLVRANTMEFVGIAILAFILFLLAISFQTLSVTIRASIWRFDTVLSISLVLGLRIAT